MSHEGPSDPFAPRRNELLEFVRTLRQHPKIKHHIKDQHELTKLYIEIQKMNDHVSLELAEGVLHEIERMLDT